LKTQKGFDRSGIRGIKKIGRTKFLILSAFLALALTISIVVFRSSSGYFIAVVNDEKIPLAEFKKKIENKLALMGDGASSLSENQLSVLHRDVLNELVDEKLMLDRARKLGLTISDDELQRHIEAIRQDYSKETFDRLFTGGAFDYKVWSEEMRKRLLLEKLIMQEVNEKVSVTDNEVLAFLNQHVTDGGVSEERIHLSQIVLQDKDQAQAALRRLKDGEDFAALAEEISAGPEAQKGGDMGFFSRGVLPETFDNVIFTLQPGKISDVIETPYGYHIFKVILKEKGGKKRMTEEKEYIRETLKREKEDRQYNKWLEELRSVAVIRINESLLQKTGQKHDP